MVKGVIFDLDGTLIDSMGIWNQIDKAFLIECGVKSPPNDISERVRKMTVDESAEYFISEFGLNLTKSYIINRIEQLVRKQYEELIPLKKGVYEILDYLDERKIPYGIATATYKKLALSVLERYNILERFLFVLTDSEYPAGKTLPDIFNGGADIMKLKPSEVLVAEDSLHCIETSASAGFFTVGVYDDVSCNDWNRIKEIADASVFELTELKKYIM